MAGGCIESRIITIPAGELVFTALETPPAGGGQGPIALCLHGFPDNHHSFDDLAPVLSAAGFHVIAPLLPGYEPSSQPADGDYSAAAVADHLGALVRELAKQAPVHLIGHDWGAVIGHVVAADRPEGLASWTAIAIPPTGRLLAVAAGAPWLMLPFWYIGVFQARVVSDWLLSRGDWQFVDLLWRRWSPGWSPPEGVLDSVKQTLATPGVKKAALAYYRALVPFGNRRFREGMSRASRRVKVPSLILAGTTDGCFKLDAFRRAIRPEDYPAGVALEVIEGAGHFLHREKPDQVNALILDHLRRA